MEILNDPPKNRKLQMELAITIDFGEPFVKATYKLEGDGPLALSAYEEITTLNSVISFLTLMPLPPSCLRTCQLISSS